MTLTRAEAPDDLMTSVDAGRILGISVDMVRLLARNGRLPFMSTVRGVRLFRRADVEQLAKQRADSKGEARATMANGKRGARTKT
jgi:excisionase family DNA binding protein